jgi:glycine/D-amino acid oxidase-like deaminating enzyme
MPSRADVAVVGVGVIGLAVAADLLARGVTVAVVGPRSADQPGQATGAAGRPALVNFLFDGGDLTQTQAEQRLRLATTELTEWCLAPAEDWNRLLAPHMARRIHACARALHTGHTAYLQHGWPPSTAHQ